MVLGWVLSDPRFRESGLVIKMTGFLNSSNSSKLAGRFTAYQRSRQRVILDCTGLSSIDSEGRQVLDELQAMFEMSGANLVIVGLMQVSYIEAKNG
jgi:anti-anti-sigma regulatory factor